MFRYLALSLSLAAALILPALAQDSDGNNGNFDVRSSVGDLHVGADADARKAGLPLYPGARMSVKAQDKDKDADSDKVNLGLLTEAFGFKLIVAKYDSEDAPVKVVDFYREKLKKYGRVLECHSQKHGGHVEANVENKDSKDSKENKELKCEENSGPVTELKVGTEDNQHVVAVEPRNGSKGSTFAIVYMHTRGKLGDI
jgi:hypothetical protein